ncbi:hypothetical protein [Stetteria hydrogenophila]
MEGPPVDVAEALSAGIPGELERRAREAGLSWRFVRVSREPEVWVYLGESGDYIVIPGLYCSCPRFQLGLSSTPFHGCHHVHGVRYAVEEGRYREVEGLDLAQVVREVFTLGRAVSVRRAVFTG